jgi:segregation and condensation protein B
MDEEKTTAEIAEEPLAAPSAEDDPAQPADTAEVSESASAAAVDQLMLDSIEERPAESSEAKHLAVLEAIVYVTDEPLSVQQIATALGQPVEYVRTLLARLTEEFARPEHGLSVREVAGGYIMATKPEHHEAVRAFVKNLNPPLKLSLAALETLAVIAYKQPITAPEIMEIRGVQGAGVLKTLIDRKLITTAGRKNVIGRPILYKTTKEFLVQFGLKDLNELPTLKEFEELRRLAFGEGDESVLGAETPGAAAAPVDPFEIPESPAPPAPEPETEPASEPEPEQPGVAPDEPEMPAADPDEHHG